MKKIIVSAGMLLISLGAFAQVEIGLKVTPNLAWNRVEGTNTFANSESEGSRMHFNGGLVLDKFFGDNYAFSTGLILATKGGTITVHNTALPMVVAQPVDIMVQYLELPVTLKLFTNEIAPDMRLYFQIGGAIGGLTAARIDGEKNVPTGVGTETEKATKRFNTFELSALAGAGVEYQLGQSTKLFAGLAYQHGLTDVADKSFAGPNGEDFGMKNSLLGIDVGIKF